MRESCAEMIGRERGGSRAFGRKTHVFRYFGPASVLGLKTHVFRYDDLASVAKRVSVSGSVCLPAFFWTKDSRRSLPDPAAFTCFPELRSRGQAVCTADLDSDASVKRNAQGPWATSR